MEWHRNVQSFSAEFIEDTAAFDTEVTVDNALIEVEFIDGSMNFDTEVTVGNQLVEVGFDSIQVITEEEEDIEHFEGPYTVIPAVTPQTLATYRLRMDEDLQIEAIPYFETSNQHGETIIIGG